MPEDSPIRKCLDRFPPYLECHTCHKPVRNHSDEEFKECHKPQRTHIYVWMKGPVQYFGMEGAIREGWGKPTLRHAIGYLEQRYGSQEAPAIELLKDRAGLIPESPPDRPAPW